MAFFTRLAIALSAVSLVSAQYGFGGSSHGDDGNGGNNGGSNNPYNNGGSNFNNQAFLDSVIGQHKGIVIAHAVLAASAFVILFPIGAILIRLGNFRGLWLVHAFIQGFAYITYICGAALGIYIATHINLLNQAHAIIGLVLVAVLFIQAILGALHHWMFKKHNRRVVWSYGHIWLGRAVVTLGIINGGLGLQLAKRLTFFTPPDGAIIAYSVIAAVAWVVYMTCAIIGEVRRSRVSNAGVVAPKYATGEDRSTSSIPPPAPGMMQSYHDHSHAETYMQPH